MRFAKRMLAWILSITMMLSCSNITVYAAGDDLSLSDFVLDLIEEDGSLIVTLSCTKEVSRWGAGAGVMDVFDERGNDATKYFELTAISTVVGDNNDNEDQRKWSATANDPDEGDTLGAGEWTSYTYNVSDKTPSGDYSFEMTFLADDCYDNDLEDYSVSGKTISVTYTIAAPDQGGSDAGNESDSTETASEFEIYYQIAGVDSDKDGRFEPVSDSDGDGYFEIDAFSCDVAVDIYIKADAATTLQAFDIYPTWDKSILSCLAVTGEKIVTSEMSAAKPHFYSVGENGLNLPVNTTGVKIATLTVQMLEAAVYGTRYSLGFAEETNAAQQKDDQSVTVIVDNKNFKGLETLKTYTVTYDANGGSGAPEASEKQHNVEFLLNATGPVREGYTFLGWSTSRSATVAEESYGTNGDVMLYAVWSQKKFTVTWKNEDGTNVLETDENVVYGMAPSFDKDNPTKGKTDQFTYTFAGWATAPNQTNGILEENLPVVTENVTYYAVFTSTTNKYDVVFNMNGHGDEVSTQSVEYGQKAAKPSDPQVAGFTFGGWYTDEECKTEFEFDTPITGGITLYALWTANQVKVTLNAAGGKINDKDSIEIDVTFGSEYGSLAEPTRNGYTFVGWFIGESEVKAETTVSNENAHALTAKWAAESYTITFKVNGGTLPQGVANPLQYTTEDSDKCLPTVTKTGATFDGWKPESNVGSWDASKSYSAEAPVKGMYGNVTLVAEWSNNPYTIVKVSNEGGTVTPNKYSANYNEVITLEVKPADGWQITRVYYTEGDAGEKVVVEKSDGGYTFAMPAANIKVGADFEKINYNVTVNSANGHVIADKTTAQVGDKITLTVTPATGYKLSNLTVTCGGDNIVVTDNKFTMPAGDVTVTATFVAEEFTITFANTGDSKIDPIKQAYGTNVNAPDDPTKTGYTFKGWDVEIPDTMPANDMTITAIWEANSYNVTLNTNGGVYAGGYTAPGQYTYDQPLTLPNGSQITKAGYTFGGWYEDPNFNGASVSEIAAGQINNKTYYAKWNANTYTITFNKEDGTLVGKVEFKFGATSIEVPEVPTKNGYTGVWGAYDLNNPSNQTVTPVYTEETYTITLNANGGNVTPSVISYKVTDTVTLPTPVNGLYTFVGWKPQAETGSWNTGTYNAGEYAGQYGTVTLVAQWKFDLNYSVEDYKYAADKYVMLRIATESNANAFKFGDSVMYYSDDTYYKLDNMGVFFTLIEKEFVDEVNHQLTDAGIAKLTRTNDAAATIAYDGDVNGDQVVNIADANAVYQMVQNGGNYYSVDQLSIPERLKADMNRSTSDNTADHRASIADVEAIVALINQAAEEMPN